MSEEHKQKLATGRKEGNAVRRYLEAVSADRRPGRPVDPASIEQRIGKLQTQIDEEPNAAKRVDLIQRRLDLEVRLAELEQRPNLDALEEEFVQAARGYSERKGISYHAWREAGVPAGVLKRAGITRTRRT